ncbi:Serine/threonine-protein phosphatase 6 regulatory ankyrin repeat subunit, partial [Globisporangium polare]
MQQQCSYSIEFQKICEHVVACLHDIYAIDGDWVAILEAEYSQSLVDFLAAMLRDHCLLLQTAAKDPEPAKTVVLLQYEHSKSREEASSAELALLETVLSKVIQHAGVALSPLSSWFLPRYEIEIADLVTYCLSCTLAKRHGTWLHSTVMIRECDAPQDVFMHHANHWVQHNHP